MDRKAAWLIGLIGLAVALALAPLGILTAESPAQSPNQTPFICIDDAGLLSFCNTPMPTWTPAHTETATHEPTPTVTATVPAVPSSTPTATPTQVLSPTMETTLPPTQPTMTPTPSMTPTPDLSVCYATVQVNLRLRDAAVDGDTIGFWAPGDRVIVYSSEFVHFPNNPERVDEWSDVSDLSGVKRGWSAGWYNFNRYLWYDTTPACLEARFPEPAHTAALLWHTVPGFNIGNARISYGILSDKGIGYGLKPYAGMNECIDALDRGGTCIYRHGAPDCPQNIGSADPRQSARDFLQYGQSARDRLAGYEKAYYEPLNECQFGGSQSDTLLSYVYWWDEWLDEYIIQATARGYPKLVIPTMGPGHGEAIQYRIWKDELNFLALQGGMMGEHAYTPGIEGGLCGCDEWLACRHRTNEAYRQAEGVDIDVAITESAKDWGGSAVDIQDMICWYEQVRHDTFLHSVSLWTMGHHPTWPLANLDEFVIPIAQGVN